MARSKVEKLPEGARRSLESWLAEFLAGRMSLDEVMNRLEALLVFNGLGDDAPSRSSVGRYAQKFAKVADRLKRAQQFREVLAAEMGPQVADGQGVKVLVGAFESLCYDLLAKLEDDQPLDPKSLHDFAKAIHHAASAIKVNADRELKVEDAARKKAAAAGAKEARAMGLTEDKVRQIEKAILGVDRE